jgi:hypothetical protein
LASKAGPPIVVNYQIIWHLPSPPVPDVPVPANLDIMLVVRFTTRIALLLLSTIYNRLFTVSTATPCGAFSLPLLASIPPIRYLAVNHLNLTGADGTRITVDPSDC